MTALLTVGVDLAAEPAGTAVARIDWSMSPPRASLLPPKLTDSQVLDAIRADGVVKAGVDCPFGWPEGFVDAVSAHGRRDRWPGGVGKDARRLLRLRSTDRHVAERFKEPLSVSSTFIGVTAMRWAAMMDGWEQAHGRIDRVGAGTLVEVYPAPAMRRWGLHVDGYKDGDGWRAARQTILRRLHDHLDLDDEFWRRALSSKAHGDDPIDALVAALVGGAAATPGGVEGPPESGTDKRRLAEAEGWIAIPTVDLSDIAPVGGA